MAILLQILVLVGLAAVLRILLRGAPYLPSKPMAIREQVEFSEARNGFRIAELGSGDGRVVVALAQAGATVHGYENNPALVAASRRRITAAGVGDRATVTRCDLWKVDYSDYDAVVVFGMSHIMKKLSRKLKSELQPGAIVVSNAFPLPGWNEVARGESAIKYVR